MEPPNSTQLEYKNDHQHLDVVGFHVISVQGVS